MKREIKFEPVSVTLLGVIVYCANNEIATELLSGIARQNLPISGVERQKQFYCFSPETALKAFLNVYNEITDRQ